MKYRKSISVVLCFAMIILMFAGCEPKPASGSGAAEGSSDLPVIRVAVMPYYLSAGVGYMMDNKLDEAAGFKIEPVMFPSGAPINEALASDVFDIAPTGGAFVFGVANYGAIVVGSHVNGTGGNEIWIRKDSPMASVKGANPDFPEVLGDAATAKDSVVLQTTGTTGQLAAVKWLEAIGVDEGDVQIVHMDFAQVYQGFKTGEGDVAALVSPYCFQTQDDWVKAADLTQLDTQLYEEIIMPKEKYEDKEMYDLAVKFVKALYATNDILEGDMEVKVAAVKKWYTDNGNEADDDAVRSECSLKPYVTTEEASALVLGKFEMTYAEFMLAQDKIEEDKLSVIKSSIGQEFLDKAVD